MTAHAELRSRNRQLRASLSQPELEQAAQMLFANLSGLEAYRNAGRIAAYFAVNGEIGLQPLIDDALAQGKRVYLPNLDQQALRFAPYFHQQKMRLNKFRLPEPDVADDDMLTGDQLDLVLAPLVVFDDQCNRIGMGGGFYDRSFAFRKNRASVKPVLIGVAHELQKAERLVPESWDVRLDMVVTDESIYQPDQLAN